MKGFFSREIGDTKPIAGEIYIFITAPIVQCKGVGLFVRILSRVLVAAWWQER